MIGDVLGVLGNVAKTAGFGVARKHSIPKKAKARKGKGIEQGEGMIGDVLGVLGNVAKTAGFGVARKHSAPKKTKTKKGKGILTDLAKTAFKAVANKGIEAGSNYLQDKVSGMGNKRFAKVRRVVGRRAPPEKRSFGGSGVDGGALYPAGYGGALYPSGC